MRIRRALLSVSDKRGLDRLGRALADLGVEILSTGGTATALERAGVPVLPVCEFTGFPEILDGRVKTLHPRIYAGLLARRDDPTHLETLDRHGIPPIDMVVVNLYPFRETAARHDASLEEALEQIDIGGPCMIRAAAKNHPHVTVVTDPSQYDAILGEMRSGGGAVSPATRHRLAVEAFGHTALYDAAIRDRLEGGRERFPRVHLVAYRKVADLRYGENPHQKAAAYRPAGSIRGDDRHGIGAGGAELLSGAELSYNNLVDVEAALSLVRDLEGPAAAVVKHANPCGAAEDATILGAMAGALRGDPQAAFGGIVAASRTVDAASAREMTRKGRFLEAVAAPDFDPEALEALRGRSGWGERLRILRVSLEPPRGPRSRFLEGGLLLQDPDTVLLDEGALRVVAGEAPDPEGRASLRFAMAVCKHVKSNAVVLARGREVVGVGAGQMSRVEALRIAVRTAGERARGAVLASDAFFPFRDSIDEAARAGVAAVIQPGGSRRDPEVIAAAREHGISMLLTGIRHFLH